MPEIEDEEWKGPEDSPIFMVCSLCGNVFDITKGWSTMTRWDGYPHVEYVGDEICFECSGVTKDA